MTRTRRSCRSGSSVCGFWTSCCPTGRCITRRRVQRLVGRLDVAALETSIGEILNRHDVLRTRFVVIDGEPRQLVAPPEPLRLQVDDLSALSSRHARSRSPATGRGVLPPAVRPRARTAVHHAPAAARGRSALAAVEHAPHRHRPLVEFDFCTRAGRAVRGFRSRPRLAAAGAAGAVRRFRGLAARMAARAGAGTPPRVLARRAGRFAGAGVAVRSAAACRGDRARRSRALHASTQR